MKRVMILFEVAQSYEGLIMAIGALLTGLGLPKLYDVIKSSLSDKAQVRIATMENDKEIALKYQKAVHDLASVTKELARTQDDLARTRERLKKTEQALDGFARDVTRLRILLNAALSSTKFLMPILEKNAEGDPVTSDILRNAKSIFDEIEGDAQSDNTAK